MSTEIPGDGPLVPLKTVNAILGIGLSTSYAMLREGRYPLPTVRIGRHHRVHRDALEAFLSDEPRHRLTDFHDLLPYLNEDIRDFAEELVARAPNLSREQLSSIRAILTDGDRT